MSSSEQWTIESIRDALGAPALAQRFLTEINKAPAHQLLHVFAKWERIAKNMRDAFRDADEIVACEARGEEPPGEWIDGTGRIQRAADRIRSQGAA
ncbi:hypothetical protein CUT44_10695 [Streptomyces carminius]|uniref:Uncharacterized protein n=1 Tax=Streptomyces carminius TaxID=2665496 RepID=A0A2M8M0A0_9ACTN|nr:hypothetical protein [Streptomyces carminius]PJE97609.1 hypothetical protein CUT44_10695 [Streptomyces carminius]